MLRRGAHDVGTRSPDRSPVATVSPAGLLCLILPLSVALILSSSCGHRPTPSPAPAPVAPPSPASACLLGTSGVSSRDTLTVVVPQSDSASVAAANEYDTLIRLDCVGRPIPGLASSWTHDSSGLVWAFVLPDSSLAEALVTAWNASDSASAVLEMSGVKD